MDFQECVCNKEYRVQTELNNKWHFSGVFVMVKSTGITYTTNGILQVCL